MAAALTARLGARPGSVSLKAKTNEGMGFIGRGEGHRGHRGRHPGGALIESLLAWLSQLPPAAVYAVLALLAAVENVIPPVPSDAAVALGAFLSNRGLTTPLGVFVRYLGVKPCRSGRGLLRRPAVRAAPLRNQASAAGCSRRDRWP